MSGFKHVENPCISSWSMLWPSSCQTYHRHRPWAFPFVCSALLLPWSTGNHRGSWGRWATSCILRSRRARAGVAAPQSHIIPHVLTFRCALGWHKTMKAKEAFWWERTAWPRVVSIAPKHHHQLCEIVSHSLSPRSRGWRTLTAAGQGVLVGLWEEVWKGEDEGTWS